MKSPLYSLHRHGVLLAVCVAACSPIESSLDVGEASWNTQSANTPGPLAPDALPVAMPPECAEAKPCMRYRIPLLGNPGFDIALRNKYIAAFGDACYMSEISTFDCFYKTWQDACADAVKIGEVWGGAPYDKGYTCQPVPGSKDYTLQIGPDPALKITINYQKAPRQTPLIDVNGTPTEVKGPYRNLPEPAKVEPGRGFDCSNQKKTILQANRNAHAGQIESDLQGYLYPCPEKAPMMCKEPVVLKDPSADPPPQSNDPDRAEVHHVVRATDKRSCRWGTNSNKNAAVISRRLNEFLYNKPPSSDEVTRINAVPPSPP